MKKLLGICYLSIIMLLIFTSCNKSKEVVYRIGALIPMTGSGALYGQYAIEGIQIAVEEANKAGGIKGKKIEIASEDNRSNAKDGVSAFQSLIAKDVQITLTEFSPVVVACGPIADQTKTVLLNCGAQSPKIRECGPFVFSAIIDANVEAESAAKFLFDTLHISAVCTYVINTETGINSQKVFINAFQNLGGRILMSEVHDQGALDYRSALVKIQKTKAKAVYLVSLVKESAQILKQAAELGLITQWMSYASFQGPDIINIAGKAAEGVLYTYPWFDSTNNLGRIFRNTYLEKYNREPDIYASTFYDGAKIAIESFKDGKITGEAIQQYLKSIHFNGVTGTTTFKSGNWVEKPVEIRTIRNGEFVKYQSSR
jgi:branched-chain amino acid transport system substrate-binding protein